MKNIKLRYPRLTDPRFLFILFTYTFLAYALMLPGYGRHLYEYLYLAFWCSLFDLILHRYIQGVWAVPISGLIAAFGIFIVNDVIDLKYYIILAFIAIGSKAFIRINNRHIFNPGNFATVIGCFGLPNVICNGGFLRWDGNLSHSLYIFILGSILAIYVNRWVAAFSFILFSLILSPIQTYLAHEVLLTYYHALMWQGTIIYIFFMITDPKTSPNRRSYQFIFGAAVALVTQIIRFTDVRLAEHAALVIVCLIYAFIDKKVNDQKIKNEWKTNELVLGDLKNIHKLKA